MFSWFRRRSKVYRPLILLQQLEDRIVLDAAVADQQLQTDSVDHAAHVDIGSQAVTPGPAQAIVQAPQTTGQTATEAALPHQAADGQPLNVILVSNAVADVAAISHAAKDNAQVIVFDHAQDNLSTVVAKLDNLAQSTGHQIGTIAIVDHGGAGYFDVGSDHINVHNLWAYEAKFQSLRADLASGAQIQFYACDTAGNVLGTDLVNSIALYTGANVFASVDGTGGSHGNWTLEYSASTGASFHSIIDSGALNSQQADLGGNPGEPMNTWFQGTGTFTGWDIYNWDQGVWYTKDHVTFWDHLDSTGEWRYCYNELCVHTDALGDAPYGDGYGPLGTWFHDSLSGGTYSGYDVYIGTGVTYFSLNHSATGATFWQHTDAGAWSYYDASAWKPTTGFNVEPMNVWFHGYGADAGWDTYNGTGLSYFTHDYATFWQHTTSPAAWTYYNGSGWASTDNLGHVQYDSGLYGTPNNWFHASSGTYSGYDVYIGTGVTYFSLNHSATSATFWQHTDAGAWSYYDASAWKPTTGFNVEPMNVWFHGYGPDAGWDTYNGTGLSYFTHDYATFWQHTTSPAAWTYYNGIGWASTDNLGDAQYDTGLYGTPNSWFHTSSGTYSGYDVYIGKGVTYFSLNHSATSATFWQHTDAGAWSYYDASAWKPTTGFNVEPMNVWFHGYGADAGWDTYNGTGLSYFTHDYATFWQHTTSPAAWTYYNGSGWASTDNLGHVQYDSGLYGTPNNWFHASSGTYSGYDVYIGTGVTYFSLNHSATSATFWQHTDAGAWSYYDASAWKPTTGFNVEPMNVWFHGYGADAGWDTYNDTSGSYFTKNYQTLWGHKTSGGSWTYYNTSAWVTTDALGDAPYGDGSHYHSVDTWFMVPSGVGAYSGHNAYIGVGIEYYQDNTGAVPPLYWAYHSATGEWDYWDGNTWSQVSGFGQTYSVDDRIEYWVLYYMNQYREHPVAAGPYGVPPVQPDFIWNSKVDYMAEKHLQDILSTHVWAHGSTAFPAGWQTLEDRGAQIGWAGWSTGQIGENLWIQYYDLNTNGQLDQGSNEVGSVNTSGWTDAQARQFAQQAVYTFVENDAGSNWGHRTPITNETTIGSVIPWNLYYAGVASAQGIIVVNFSTLPYS